MKIVATSDFHGHLPDIPECDILLIAGDVCPLRDHSLDRQKLWYEQEFTPWLEKAPAKHIVGIAGNHDFYAQENFTFQKELPWTYLWNEAVQIEGLNIYGSPYVQQSSRWAFSVANDDILRPLWEAIPDDTEILLTHGPALGYGDMVMNGAQVGSAALRARLLDLAALKLHVFGHIHEGYGTYTDWTRNRNHHLKANVSHCNVFYDPINPPMLLPYPGEDMLGSERVTTEAPGHE